MRVRRTSAELTCVAASRKSRPSIIQSGFVLFAVSADSSRAFDIAVAIDGSLLSTRECRLVPVVGDTDFVFSVNSFVKPSM